MLIISYNTYRPARAVFFLVRKNHSQTNHLTETTTKENTTSKTLVISTSRLAHVFPSNAGCPAYSTTWWQQFILFTVLHLDFSISTNDVVLWITTPVGSLEWEEEWPWNAICTWKHCFNIPGIQSQSNVSDICGRYWIEYTCIKFVYYFLSA